MNNNLLFVWFLPMPWLPMYVPKEQLSVSISRSSRFIYMDGPYSINASKINVCLLHSSLAVLDVEFLRKGNSKYIQSTLAMYSFPICIWHLPWSRVENAFSPLGPFCLGSDVHGFSFDTLCLNKLKILTGWMSLAPEALIFVHTFSQQPDDYVDASAVTVSAAQETFTLMSERINLDSKQLSPNRYQVDPNTNCAYPSTAGHYAQWRPNRSRISGPTVSCQRGSFLGKMTMKPSFC